MGDFAQGPAGRLEIARAPAEGAARGDMLLTHGAWSSLWYWLPNYLPFLASEGWNVTALSLRGHGGSAGRVRWASAADYAADVAAVAATLDNPVIVGHSMGGFAAQKYAATHGARGMALLASVPPSGVWPTFGRSLRDHPLAVAKVNLTLDLKALVANPDIARDLLYSRGPDDRSMDAHLAHLQSESFRVFIDMLLAPIRRRADCPVFVLGARDDHIFSAADIARTARFYGVTPEWVDGSHMVTIDTDWRRGADALAAWAKGLA